MINCNMVSDKGVLHKVRRMDIQDYNFNKTATPSMPLDLFKELFEQLLFFVTVKATCAWNVLH